MGFNISVGAFRCVDMVDAAAKEAVERSGGPFQE
jgi:hypothetical protein